MFAYSLREKTMAHRRYVDDVPEDVKKRRLREITELFYTNAALTNAQRYGGQQRQKLTSLTIVAQTTYQCCRYAYAPVT